MRESLCVRWRLRAPGRMVSLIASAIAVAALYGGLSVTEAAATPTMTTPVVSCSTLGGMSLAGLPGSDTATVAATDVAGSGCQVQVDIVDTSTSNVGQPGNIRIDVTLPDSWNGNYMALGGGVYCNPASFEDLGNQWLAAGYAMSTTDCGHTGYATGPLEFGQYVPSLLTSGWVVNPSGGLNWNRINDFGYLSFHLEAVLSKELVNAYYGAGPQYSFWNGCSTGGRQAMSEAQKYPADFNGVLAGAPALNWDQFMVAQMWPQLVMEWNHDYLSSCKENLVNQTLQSRCRDQNGKIDGVFDPRNCNVMGILRSLIGKVTPCGVFTQRDARVVQEIWQGPRHSRSQKNLRAGTPVWFGLEPGASMAGPYLPFLGPGGGVGLANTITSPTTGQLVGAPFIPSADWFQNWIKQDQSWVYTDETYQQFWQDFKTSGQLFDSALAADNPNMSQFQKDGGKLIMWQGLADQLIFTGDSINFYNRGIVANGGLKNTQSFWRYFLVPGVQHCGTPGEGSIAPTNPMQAVINWVEQGTVPTTLAASGQINSQPVTRPLCPYPAPDAVYTGGDPNTASSYKCRHKVVLDNPFKPGPAGNMGPGQVRGRHRGQPRPL